MNVKRSAIKLFISKIGFSALTFLGIIYFARVLPQDQLGSYFLFQALSGLLLLPADMGLRGALEKRISEDSEPEAVLSSGLILKIVPFSIVVSSVVLAQGYIDAYVGHPVAFLLAGYLLVRECSMIVLSVLRAELRVDETATLLGVRQVVWTLVSVSLVWQGFGVEGIIAGMFGADLLVGLWGCYRVDTSLGRPTWDAGRSLFDFARFNFVTSVGQYGYNWTDVVVIGLFLPQGAVAVYEIAWRVTKTVTLLSEAIGRTLFPQVSNWDAAGANDAIRGMIPEAITGTLLLVIPAFFGTLLFAREILDLVFGATYAGGSLVLIVLMTEKLFQAPQRVIGGALQGIDRVDLSARASVVSVLLNVVLNFVLVWQIGVIGAAIATTVAFVLNTFLHAYYLDRHVQVSLNVSHLGWLVVASGAMSLVLFVVTRFVTVSSLPVLLALVGAGAALYAVFLWVYRPVRAMLFGHARDVLA